MLEEAYNLAKSTFNRKEVFPSEVERVSELLSAVPLHEIGLEEQASLAAEPATGERRSLLQRFGLSSGTRIPTITYMHVCENEDFGIGIFCIPAGSNLPFHDHPKMTVISKVMYGEIEVVSYDWVKQEDQSREYGQPKPARLVLDKSVKATDPPVILYASSGGNIHSFRARKPTAILDLLAPPYDIENPGAERQCTYYKEASSLLADGTVLLEKIPDPNTFRIASTKYLGLQVE